MSAVPCMQALQPLDHATADSHRKEVLGISLQNGWRYCIPADTMTRRAGTRGIRCNADNS